MIRDRDRAYGNEFSRRVRDLGIRSIKTAIRAPKMNCYAERLIGTIRRELFDHVIVSSERHARRLLREFQVLAPRSLKPRRVRSGTTAASAMPSD